MIKSIVSSCFALVLVAVVGCSSTVDPSEDGAGGEETATVDSALTYSGYCQADATTHLLTGKCVYAMSSTCRAATSTTACPVGATPISYSSSPSAYCSAYYTKRDLGRKCYFSSI